MLGKNQILDILGVTQFIGKGTWSWSWPMFMNEIKEKALIHLVMAASQECGHFGAVLPWGLIEKVENYFNINIF